MFGKCQCYKRRKQNIKTVHEGECGTTTTTKPLFVGLLDVGLYYSLKYNLV